MTDYCAKCKKEVEASRTWIFDELGEPEFSFWKFLCTCGFKWMSLCSPR